MGFLDKLLGRDKSPEREGGSGSDAGGGREGARVTEPARTSGEGTRPAQPPGERPEGAGPERGPN